MRRIAVLLVLIFAVSGCSSKYKVDAVEAPKQSISTEKRFYITLANNGSYGNRHYKNSGRQTSEAVLAALAVHGADGEIGESLEKIDAALAAARTGKFDYVFVPQVLHWEDRATEWSSLPDRITIRYVVYDAQSGKEVASTTIRGSSKWATFGGDHPQDLLPKPTEQFVKTLF